MPHERTGATLNFWNSTGKRLISLFSIERTDGVVFRFTNHNTPISFQGETWTPSGGVGSSARRREDAFKDHDIEFRGAITSNRITDDDLLAGKYREAKVTEYVVDHRYPFAGAFFSDVWWIDQVEFTAEEWRTEMSGPTRFLKEKIGDLVGRTCDRTLGDSQCGVSLPGVTASGVVVDGMEDANGRRVIIATVASLPTQVDDYYAYGFVTFTSGANNGLVGEVKTYQDSNRRIELQVAMPFPIAIGTTFSIVAGCDRLRATCRDKFSNILNNGGFGFMPTSDGVLKATPRRV